MKRVKGIETDCDRLAGKDDKDYDLIQKQLGEIRKSIDTKIAWESTQRIASISYLVEYIKKNKRIPREPETYKEQKDIEQGEINVTLDELKTR